MDPTINAMIMFVTLSRFWIITSINENSLGRLVAPVSVVSTNAIINQTKTTQITHIYAMIF